METKPYNLQSPEQIAKDYGGNKQKIAEAMQMGILDPTAGTMAGMFIDRMRSAAQTEAVPQQTVAQQVMAPQPQMPMGAPPAPAGLGATPQAAAMPPMGAAPPMGMPAPQGEMPMMAEGGMVPPYASGGGLSDMPLPDGMFDEPSNGGFGDGYAGGGMVAFRTGKVVKAPPKGVAALLAGATEDELAAEQAASQGTADDVAAEADIEAAGDIGVSSGKQKNLGTQLMKGTAFQAPAQLGGFRNDIFGNLDRFAEAAPYKTKRAEELEAILEKQRSPEERKKSRKEDMWMALGQIGAKMASTPGSLLQAASAGIGEALPGIAASAKERRGEERALTRELLAEERTGNKEVEARAGIAMDMLKSYNSLEQAFQDRNFNNTLTRLGIDADLVKAKLMAGAGIQGALISAAASRFVGGLGFQGEQLRAGATLTTAVSDFLKTPQGMMGLNAARKAGVSDADYISNLRKSLSGGTDTIKFDSKGNQI